MTVSPTPSPPSNEPWADRVLLRVEVGSTAHGTGLPDAEDYDELGIIADPWAAMIGIAAWGEALGISGARKETIVYRPGRGDGDRSGPGDYDLVLHGARKFCRLAMTGNPSVLMVLFGPVRYSTSLGEALREIPERFWSQKARAAFLGYARQQRERLEGVRGGKHTNRPELIERFGYDTKYAMHMVRLAIQGIEYMRTGRITLPVPGDDGVLLRAIRHGELTLASVLAIANELEGRLADVRSPAPDKPDTKWINGWLSCVAIERGPTRLPERISP